MWKGLTFAIQIFFIFGFLKTRHKVQKELYVRLKYLVIKDPTFLADEGQSFNFNKTSVMKLHKIFYSLLKYFIHLC